MKKIAILGITGSIGKSTLEVIREHHSDFKIVLASSHNNLDMLLKISDEFDIDKIVLTNKSKISSKTRKNLYFGKDSLLSLINDCDCDIILNAVSGSAGLIYTDAIINSNHNIALANKESLVMAGHIFKRMIKRKKINMLPVDSEHSAIFQSIGNSLLKDIKSLIITASGGPFRNLPLNEFSKITPEQALAHPTWDMGAKITIDSATMVNKALEVIEAHWLFDMPYKGIKSVIHPQSIIHSFVEFIDGSILAQLGFPSMQLPILIALAYPNRIESSVMNTDITKLPSLSFFEMDKKRYPLYFIGIEVGKKGGLYPTIMNSANEAAIELFIKRKISFLDITRLIKIALDKFQNTQNPSLEEIIQKNDEVFDFIIKNYKNLL